MANAVFNKSRVVMLLLISVLLLMYSGCDANGTQNAGEKQEEVNSSNGSSVLLKAESGASGQELAKLMEETQSILQKRTKLLQGDSTVTIREDKYILVQFSEEYEPDMDAVFGTGKKSEIRFLLADGTEFATRADVKDAGVEQVHIDDAEGYSVSIAFTKEGAEKLLTATKKASNSSISEDNIMANADGTPLAVPNGSAIASDSMIVMIDDQIVAAPSVAFPIEGGEAIIESFSRKAAIEMAMKIQGDVLPLPLTIVDDVR